MRNANRTPDHSHRSPVSVLRTLLFTTVVAAASIALAGCPGGKTKDTNNGGGTPVADGPSGDQVREWNALVLTLGNAEDKFLTLKGLRTTLMMHLAMHDALNAIQPRFSQYAYTGTADGADPTAAVAQAAFAVASSQYSKPEQVAELEKARDKWMATVTDEAAKAKAVELGDASAKAILAKREGDGWNTEVEYKFHPMGPGVYAEFKEHSGTPEGFIFGAAWAKATPFALETPAQVRVPPPPAISSDEYVTAYNEVKEVGWAKSTTRTADQTHLANWWKDFAENSINRLAREVTSAEKLDLWTSTRFFALINMSLYDAYVSVFENKYHYNHWRPYTAIRWAANDENPKTAPDLEWNNTHGHTYAFPSYPSAHGSACAAMFSVYTNQFGDDYEFTMTTEEVNQGGPFSPMMKNDPPTRSFKRFSDAAMECALSRVYLGIHFRYDSVEGNKHGSQVGAHVLENFLKPVAK